MRQVTGGIWQGLIRYGTSDKGEFYNGSYINSCKEKSGYKNLL